MIIGNLAIPNDDVMRQHASHGLMKSAADGVIGNRKIAERRQPTRMHVLQRWLDKVQC